MGRFQLLYAGIVVLCLAMIMAAGVVAAAVAHRSLAVMALLALMAVCLLAGSTLVAMGASKINSRAEDQRLVAQDCAHAARDAETDTPRGR